MLWHLHIESYATKSALGVSGTSVVQVTATDADDPSYGNSARIIYSILQGQPYFSVEPETGNENFNYFHLLSTLNFFFNLKDLDHIKKKCN